MGNKCCQSMRPLISGQEPHQRFPPEGHSGDGCQCSCFGMVNTLSEKSRSGKKNLSAAFPLAHVHEEIRMGESVSDPKEIIH